MKRKALIVGQHRSRIAHKSERSKRVEANEPVPEGKVRCPECARIVGLRADGTMRMHRSDGTIPCIGAEPSLSGDVARRARMLEDGS